VIERNPLPNNSAALSSPFRYSQISFPLESFKSQSRSQTQPTVTMTKVRTKNQTKIPTLTPDLTSMISIPSNKSRLSRSYLKNHKTYRYFMSALETAYSSLACFAKDNPTSLSHDCYSNRSWSVVCLARRRFCCSDVRHCYSGVRHWGACGKVYLSGGKRVE
jgi:hypothetical protein